MANRFTKMHGVGPREYLDRGAFILAFLVGIIGGLILKVSGFHPFLLSSFSAIVLVIYALVGWVGGSLRIEPETIGDNCYYLGFLFTLSSLAFTLYQMANGTSETGTPIHIPEVISGFGVALTSTIVGVFLRVLLMQMRVDFVAKEREVRRDINSAYSDFRKHLSGTLSQMKAFSTESIQMASERDARITKSTEVFVNDHQASLQLAADNLAKSMETSFVEASKKAVEEITRAVVNSNEQTKVAMQSLASDIETIRAQLKEQQISMADDFSRRRTQQDIELDGSVKRMANYDDAIKEYVENMTETMRAQFDGQQRSVVEDFNSRRVQQDLEFEVSRKRMAEYDEAMKIHIKTTQAAANAIAKKIIPALDSFKTRLDQLPVQPITDKVNPEETELNLEVPDGNSERLQPIEKSGIWPWGRLDLDK